MTTDAETWFEVHTANEDGWTDYHEEDDETDDFEIALDWITRSDVQWGEVRLNGELIASSDSDHNVEYAQGWGPHGKVE